MKRFSYDDIIQKFQGREVSYERAPHESCIKLVGTDFPWSIVEDEFNFFIDVITSNNLKSGYELATGTGISSLASGLGFRETGGRLLTMDAYVEEHYNAPNSGRHHEYFVSPNESRGYKSVNQLVEEYKLQEIVFPVIGWSPTDLSAKMKENNFEYFDFVFFDAGSWDERFDNDFDEMFKYLNKDKFAVLVHDTQTVPENLKRMESLLGVTHFILPNSLNLAAFIKS
jgi:predicted O-methyltransferase YrrM